MGKPGGAVLEGTATYLRREATQKTLEYIVDKISLLGGKGKEKCVVRSRAPSLEMLIEKETSSHGGSSAGAGSALSLFS